jgi:hypothetical protein
MPLFRMSVLILCVGAGLGATQADEGMWTTNAFPSDKVAQSYGFRPGQSWLDHARLSAVRLARGCSGSFVSPSGLVQTNHHCARGCIEQLSTATHNLTATGFYASAAKDEAKCPDVEINQLIEITAVTERVNKAVAGRDGAAFAAALKAERAAIAKECSQGNETIRCDVVELYHGGAYDLYKYRRYQDVRLVFAPEMAIAFFGGDPDNFEFPRYDLDVSYLRVYVDDRPLDTSANYFRYAKADAQPGDLTFTLGHPGSTHRLDTVAELEFRRDVSIVPELLSLAELRGVLTEFSSKGAEQARIANGMLFGVENTLKARKGQLAALVDPTILRNRAAAERELRARVDADQGLKAQYAGVWDNIRATLERARAGRERYAYTEGGLAFRSRLFGHAKSLVRHAVEAGKPDGERLPEHTNANFPILRQSLASTAPIYPELEKLTLTFSLTKMREVLGPDDAFVKKVLGRKSPAELARELVDGTTLRSADTRKFLLAGGQDAIAAATDPMIALARDIDAELRAIRKDNEDNINAPLTKYSGELAKAMFKVYGTTSYPDATFTLRISYGSVSGYSVNGRPVEPITRMAGLFERATGADPFRLPASWIAAQKTLNPQQAFNFVTTNDIIGGNSGSPVINQAGEVVGLIFDGNIQSLGGDFGFDPSVNRAVAVNVGALREALTKVYHAERILDELAR